MWALPMGHGEPPCPLASWAGDVRPRVALTPLEWAHLGTAPGSSPGPAPPCSPETWCCPGQLTPGALARPLPSWPRLLCSHPFRTQTAKTTNQNAALGSRSALLRGSGESAAPGRLPSSLRTDTAQTQKEKEASGRPARPLFGPRPSVSARTSLGRAFKGARALRPSMPHSGRGLPSPGAQQKVPTLVRVWRAPAGRGPPEHPLWLPSASVGNYPAATRPPPQHRCPLGTRTTPPLFL